MGDGPFRESESDLDADARAADAITRLGEWRSAQEIRVVIMFLFLWIALSPVAWVLAKEAQLALSGSWSLLSTIVAAITVPLIIAFGGGHLFLRRLLRRRMPVEIARLAELHRVSAEELARFAYVPR